MRRETLAYCESPILSGSQSMEGIDHENDTFQKDGESCSAAAISTHRLPPDPGLRLSPVMVVDAQHSRTHHPPRESKSQHMLLHVNNDAWEPCTVTADEARIVILADNPDVSPKLIRRSTIVAIEIVEFYSDDHRFVFRIVAGFSTNHSTHCLLHQRDKANSAEQALSGFTLKVDSLQLLEEWVEFLGGYGH